MLRPDKTGPHRAAYEKNKRILLRTANTCGICGHPIDMSLKHGDPMAPCIDHIIPVSKGGHPSDINNLQLAHWTCNRNKSDKLFKGDGSGHETASSVTGNRNLPQSLDWSQYNGS